MTEYEAGEALDAVIAERVMGKVPGVDFGLRPAHQWEWNEGSDYNTMSCPWCWTVSQDWVKEDEHIDSKIDARPCDRPPSDYSTDLEEALKVFAAPRENAELVLEVFDDLSGHVDCVIQPRVLTVEFPFQNLQVDGPRAICLAALKAEARVTA